VAASTVPRILTVAPKPASVTPAANCKVYGSPDPALIGTLAGFVAVDSIVASYSRTPGETVLGSPYTISATLSSTVSRPLANYTITYNTANFTITPKPASVTPDPKSKIYGDPDPLLTGTLSGFLTADGVTATYSRTPGETVAGSPYTISATLSPGAVLPNYNISNNTALFTINPAPTQFTVSSSYFTTLGSPTMIDGKLSRTGVPTVYPPGPANVLVQGVGTFPGTPGGTDGTFTANAGSLASGTYPLTFSYGGDGNFSAATSVPSTLRVEGFSATGGMIQPRTNHTSTLLGNGLVLVAGGFDPGGAPKATSELYCPDTMTAGPICPVPGQFRLVASPMPNSAARHTATLLSNGKVLVTGGGNAFAELFDPASETWTSVAGFGSVRSDHTATLLANGKVLLAGGSDGTGATLVSTMLFDPATTTFAAGPPLSFARERHSATLLASGKVLLAGGRAFSAGSYAALVSAEIYDPVTNTLASATSMSGARFGHGAALLAVPDNRVVLAGGSSDTLAAPTTSLSTVEIYDETLNTWTALTPANALQQTRREFSLNRLADGWLVAVGGVDTIDGTQRATSELFQPGAGFDIFAVGASMTVARSGHAATMLPDGRVLITGGTGVGGVVNSAELYNGP